jgi:NADH dehydrogenase
MNQPHRVVIIGGGFGGLSAARRLRHAPVRLTLVDRRNFHLFQPLLYQVAVGGLSPANIATPLRAILKRQQNAQVQLAEVLDIDAANHSLRLRDGELAYDTLIVASGARDNYFGHDKWQAYAPGLKSIEEATAIRRRVLLAFEAAERETDAERRRAWLTIVVVGGGATGVELAGAIGELAQATLRGNFRNFNPADARVILLEGSDRVLPPFRPKLSAKAAAALQRLGVSVRTNTLVTDIQADAVTTRREEKSERLVTRTVVWAAGVQASPLGQALARSAGAVLDRGGRVIVQPDLTVMGHPEVFVIGDLASFSHPTGKPLPGVAPVAMQQGRYAADLIRSRLEGKTLPPFRYRDRGSLATIGRNAAVVDLGWISFNGFLAWVAWLSIHLIYLIQFDNRLLVLLQWAWNYFTRNRSARLITGEESLSRLPKEELPWPARVPHPDPTPPAGLPTPKT